MKQFTTDHKFSEQVSKHFAEMGVWDFVNPISSQPWGGRNRIIARIRVFEKYLEPADVLQALWIHRQAKLGHPNDWQFSEKGLEHLNSLMLERSGGKFWDEMADIAKGLPSVMDYAKEEYGYPSPAQFVQMRRAAMHVVPPTQSAQGMHPN